MTMLLALLLAFTSPTAPVRHPTSPQGTGTPGIYIHDPYVVGATPSGIPNVTGKNFSCTSSQALGFADDGGAIDPICVDTATAAETTSTPSAPAAGSTTNYLFALDAGWPAMPSVIGNDGLPTPTGATWVFSYLSTSMKWDTQCTWATSWSLATFLQLNAETPGSAGTLSGIAWDSTTFGGRMKRTRSLSGAATNSAALFRETAGRESVWRGDTAGAGGWLSWQRFHIDDIKSDGRVFIGWVDTTSAITNDPSTNVNTVYVGCDEADADSNLDICSNDAAGAAACATLGAGFPCKTDNVFYDVWFYAPPNGGYINWYVENLSTPASASGRLTTELPANTVQLNWQMGCNTGATTTTQVRCGFLGTCSLGNL